MSLRNANKKVFLTTNILMKKIHYLSIIYFFVVLLFFQALINDTVLGTNDNVHYLNKKIFISENIKNFTFPLWYPYNMCGMPFVSLTVSGLFYPLNVLWLLFNPKLALNLFYIFHFCLGGTFFFYFLKLLRISDFSAFVAAFNFLFSGALIMRIWTGHVDIFAAICLLPVLLFYFQKFLLSNFNKKYAFICGVVIAFQVLAGRADLPVMSVLMLFLMSAGILLSKPNRIFNLYKFFLFFVILGFTIFVISSPQLIPSLNIARQSLRIGSYNFATFSSVPLQNIITLLLPDFFGSHLFEDFWGVPNYYELFIYTGIFTLILSFLSIIFNLKIKHLRFYFFTGIIFLLISLGRNFFLYKILYYVFPVIRSIRTPSRFAVIFQLFFSINLGLIVNYIIDKIEQKDKNDKKINYISFILIFFIGCLIFFVQIRYIIVDYVKNNIQKFENINIFTKTLEYDYNTIYQGVPRLMIIVSLIVIILNYKKIFLKKNILCYIIFFAILLDTFLWSRKFCKLYYSVEKAENHAISHYLINDLMIENARILSNEFNIEQMNYEFNKIRNITSATPIVPKDYADFIYLGIDKYNENYYKQFERQWHFFNPIMNLNSPLLSLMNCKYIILTGPTDLPELELKKVIDGKYIYENLNNKGFVIIYNNYEIKESQKEIINRLSNKDNISNIVFLEKKPYFFESISNEIRVHNEYNYEIINNHTIFFEFYLTKDSVIMISEYYHPNWSAKCYKSNRNIEVYRTNSIFLGLSLEKGLHKIFLNFNIL